MVKTQLKSDMLFGPVKMDIDAAETLDGYADHLRHLDDQSLRMRFGFHRDREAAANWALNLNKKVPDTAHVIWGTKNGWNELVGVCHLVISQGQAEIALSTSLGYRRRGISKALLDVAISYLQNRSITHVYMVCLTENTAVQNMARKSGFAMVTMDGESTVRLSLPWPTLQSVAKESISNSLTMVDRQIKMHSDIWDRFLTRPKYQAIIDKQEPENGKD